MKALLLCAGFGTRLKPLTDKIPKALVRYNNRPIIEHQIEKLTKYGVTELAVNTHHLANHIDDYFSMNSFGIRINTFFEQEILGTGGAVLNLKDFFSSEEFFIVLNVDAFFEFNLQNIIKFHSETKPLATLATEKRKSGKYLEFNEKLELIKRADENTEKNSLFAFNGLHIISSEIFNFDLPVVFCDIIDLYITLIEKGGIIKGYPVENSGFRDLGKPENLQQ